MSDERAHQLWKESQQEGPSEPPAKIVHRFAGCREAAFGAINASCACGWDIYCTNEAEGREEVKKHLDYMRAHPLAGHEVAE